MADKVEYFDNVTIGQFVLTGIPTKVYVGGRYLIITDPDFRFNNPNIAFMAVDFPAPLGPRIETISPRSTLTEHELIISGPLPYPPVILLPSKKAIINYP